LFEIRNRGVGALTGGLAGGMAGGIDAALDGRRFFDGATVVRDTSSPSYSIPAVKQNLDGSCGAACAASVDQSLGGNLSEGNVINMFPNEDFAGRGVGDVGFWDRFAANTGRVSSPMQNDPSFFYNNIRSSSASSSRFVLSTHNHSVVMQSVTRTTITKLSGNIITRYSYNVMDPANGGFGTFASRSIRNIFRIR
jgi:hypothetical protein